MIKLNKIRQNKTVNGANLSYKQAIFLSKYLISSTVQSACKQAKISRGTFYEWLKDETFKNTLERYRTEAVTEGYNLLKDALGRAVENLIELIDDPSPGVRRYVCKDIIEFNLKVKELQEIENRIDRIEKQVSLFGKGLSENAI